MKTEIRRVLVIASVMGVLGITGAVLARPSHPKKPDVTAKQKDADSVQVMVTAGKGRLGVAALQISPELRAHFGAPNDRGVLVNSVLADSPAAKAGVKVGDLITDVDGDVTRSATDILEAMSDRNKGDTLNVTLMRGGNRMDLAVTLDSDPSAITTSRVPSTGDLDQHMDHLLRDMPSMDSWGGDDDMQRQLDDAKRRIDELEKRLDKRAP